MNITLDKIKKEFGFDAASTWAGRYLLDIWSTCSNPKAAAQICEIQGGRFYKYNCKVNSFN